jgi:formimidoylglutamate deiminase
MREEAGIWFRTALLPHGWAEDVRITIGGGRVRTIEAGAGPAPTDERHHIGVPGMSNLHSHAFQRGMAGLAERRGAGGPETDNFWSWRETMYRFLDRLDPGDVEAVAAMAYAEMLEAGFTRVGEFHYLHHDPRGAPYANRAEMAERIAAAARETGIALTLLAVFYAHGNFGAAPPAHGQRRFLTDRDVFAALTQASRDAIATLPDAVLGVAPHSLRAASPAEIRAVISLVPDGPVHIHAAEQKREVQDSIAWCGRRPVETLLEDCGVDRRWCLIHATHMTGAETARLAASGAVAGLCPMTEANLGDGIFPGRAFRDAGGAFGVGSDANVLIDAAQELRQLEYAQRLATRARNVLAAPGGSTGRALFDGALAGGAQALGVAAAGLIEGAPADIVSLAADHPALLARAGDALLDGWIFAASRSPVDCVWRGGAKFVEAGRHVGRAAIERRFAAVLRRILA